MTSKETKRPVVSTGSLFKTSEGVLISVFTALCGHIVEGSYDPMVQATAIASLGVAVAGYAVARARSKS
jgi:hypothetical protein